MTLEELPIGKRAAITAVGGEAVPAVRYGTDPEDCCGGA